MEWKTAIVQFKIIFNGTKANAIYSNQ